jgi:hypothetical protein
VFVCLFIGVRSADSTVHSAISPSGPKSKNKTKGFRKINERNRRAAVHDVTLNLNKRF